MRTPVVKHLGGLLLSLSFSFGGCLLADLEDDLENAGKEGCSLAFRATGALDLDWNTGTLDECSAAGPGVTPLLQAWFETPTEELFIDVTDFAAGETGTFDAGVEFRTPRDEWVAETCTAQITQHDQSGEFGDWVVAGTVTCAGNLEAGVDNDLTDPLTLDGAVEFTVTYFGE